jgi:hypothetical protein
VHSPPYGDRLQACSLCNNRRCGLINYQINSMAASIRCHRGIEPVLRTGLGTRHTWALRLTDSVSENNNQLILSNLERATGVEPATSSLGSWHSTTELRPLKSGVDVQLKYGFSLSLSTRVRRRRERFGHRSTQSDRSIIVRDLAHGCRRVLCWRKNRRMNEIPNSW